MSAARWMQFGPFSVSSEREIVLDGKLLRESEGGMVRTAYGAWHVDWLILSAFDKPRAELTEGGPDLATLKWSGKALRVHRSEVPALKEYAYGKSFDRLVEESNLKAKSLCMDFLSHPDRVETFKLRSFNGKTGQSASPSVWDAVVGYVRPTLIQHPEGVELGETLRTSGETLSDAVVHLFRVGAPLDKVGTMLLCDARAVLAALGLKASERDKLINEHKNSAQALKQRRGDQ